MNMKEIIKEKEMALEDLEDIKKRGSFNEYVTAENIDAWISLSKAEIRKLKRENPSS